VTLGDLARPARHHQRQRQPRHNPQGRYPATASRLMPDAGSRGGPGWHPRPAGSDRGCHREFGPDVVAISSPSRAAGCSRRRRPRGRS
jgi:hypothetical protein